MLSLLLAIPFPLASQLPTPVELNSFESEGDLCNLQVKNAEISLSAEHRTHGAHGLQIKFTGNGGATLQFRAPATPWDWSMYGGLGFDLMNLSDDEIGFALQIGDGVKTDETRNVGGAGTVGPRLTVSYLFPLGSLKYREDPWLIGYFVDNEISWGGMDNGPRALWTGLRHLKQRPKFACETFP